jgi:hypothetical protein
VLAAAFPDQCSGGVGKSEDSNGGQVDGDVAIGEAEDDGDADWEEKFSERKTIDAVENFTECWFLPTDEKEAGNGESGEEIDLPISGEEPGEGEADHAHAEVDRFSARFRGKGEMVDDGHQCSEQGDDEEEIHEISSTRKRE